MSQNNLLSIKLKRARVLSELSQRELAKKLDVSDKTISAYEQGRAIPPIITLQKIACITNQSLEYFLGTTTPDQETIEYKLDIIIKELRKILNKL